MSAPGRPPPEAHRFVERPAAELQAWLDAGFDLYAADRLELAGLDVAVRWRDAGFSAAQTYELLRADPALTVAEARASDPEHMADIVEALDGALVAIVVAADHTG